jgi:hypothetical protein
MSVAQTVTGTLNFNCNFQQTQTSGNINLNGSNLNETISQSLQYVNSTGVNYGVDQLYAKQITLASTTGVYAFQTGSLTDPFGNTLAMLRIRELIIVNLNTTLGQDLEVYATASTGITWVPPVANYLLCRAGGIIRLADPLSFGGGVGQVVGSSSSSLTLNSGSNTITLNLIALGCATA